METFTHWKQIAQTSDYLGAYCFQPGERKTVTIKSTGREVVHDPNGRAKEMMVVYFLEEDKPLILNSTNGKAISKVIGSPYVENWVGKQIILAVEKVKAFGDIMEAVRVQPERVAQPVVCADSPISHPRMRCKQCAWAKRTLCNLPSRIHV